MLYFHHANGSFHAVTTVDITVYYKYETNGMFYPFPRGFQMRAGNAKATAPEPQRAVKWRCLNGALNEVTPGLPTKPCSDGLRAEIDFPNCWNGEVKDDNSHMAFATNRMPGQDNGVQGRCPASHPYKVPRLFYEVMFKIDEARFPRAQAKNPQQPFVLSTGDSTGYALHGDFMNGWVPRFLARVLRTCDGADGANLASGEPSTCFVDVVGAWLPKLPGNNPVKP
ncbi:hypothetical protein P389DRAFT_211927 [Cystobasidium minutum MCA 4210]|uniref:uncharacterized protein n=1 Tax=Cystobasidium minutum MCA 4210 TaxID=1397322 RepID=UPI0034CD7F42|eukprot:jgi/Rhomi1/211927/estExt_Genemark1.C_5_t20005